jgi:hypothetical protein
VELKDVSLSLQNGGKVSTITQRVEDNWLTVSSMVHVPSRAQSTVQCPISRIPVSHRASPHKLNPDQPGNNNSDCLVSLRTSAERLLTLKKKALDGSLRDEPTDVQSIDEICR